MRPSDNERETMDTKQIIANALRCGLAWQRGNERGRADECMNYYNDSPLSGEWAGESVSELLGDLIGRADMDPADEDTLDVINETIHHYEDGYNAAFADRSFCDRCGELIDATYGIADDSGLAWCGDECANADS